MAEPVYTRGDLVKNFPTRFSKAELEGHFSSEYVKVIGVKPDLVLIQSLAIHFRNLWLSLRRKDAVFSSPRGKAFLSVKLPVPILEREKETEKESEKERDKESEKERGREQKVESPQQVLRKSFGELSSRGKRYRIGRLLTRTPEFDELAYL
jgi:hypothetical protein